MLDPSDIHLDRSSAQAELIPANRAGHAHRGHPSWSPLRSAWLATCCCREEPDTRGAGGARRDRTGRRGRPAPTTEAVPGLGIPLGPLDQTDGIVRTLVGQISSHPTIAAWLATDQLVRHFTLGLVNIADGDTPVQAASSDCASSGIRRAQRHARFSSSRPRATAGTIAYADAFAALDARGAAQVYATVKPALQEAYDELGRPAGTIDAAMEAAIVQLLRTPVVDENVALEQKAVVYRFADPRARIVAGRTAAVAANGAAQRPADSRRSCGKSRRSSGFRRKSCRSNDHRQLDSAGAPGAW